MSSALRSHRVPRAATRQRKQSFIRRLVTPAIAIAALGYFGFHAMSGELGMVGRAMIERQVSELESELELLTAERQELVARVGLLRPESLDPDMLDERARLNLNLVHTNELVVLRPGHRYNVN
ncbi:FtsB family cell division protein [Roseibium album]|uniref:FtsB family cell division protein n=1 Tax=Roseibium album TaxID=311410 RepID=UPI0009E74D2D|nr:septum formation initiator family protein [Roseibium album]MBG6143640.1 cell division protein FtsB [Labrenzia sp. EL_142]MBG6156309.1 cell division protein FtsB [Labrenzia sp. EL_162]MBG6164092.1 cell division protein FtsB [Labrenzia sp. EL_195]MBG6176735.1 cell division protein FtsB [Labrenzia sp. EL_132]MBG6194840.1 cell division protein FtsB [Labrenzia sp. EL_159]MBG6200232.1 cell division protein FtsB [Labrenzia sp. EL_13]MBG6209897.1 cell division protein FtsB [Labrenzia sp. EL_126]